MKKSKKDPLSLLALFSALGMLLFTFCTLAWYSDKGIQIGFEIPVSTERGFFMTLADCLWMASPFILLISLSLCRKEEGRKAALILAPLPLSLYALTRFLAFPHGVKSHWTLFITLFFILLLSAFTLLSAFESTIRPLTAKLSFTYMGIETLLLILSFLFKEKYSFFYFSQLLPMGHYSHFRYSFFSVSIYLFYLLFALTLALMLLMKEEKETEEEDPSDPPSPPEVEEEENEEDLSSLSLEDLGITR